MTPILSDRVLSQLIEFYLSDKVVVEPQHECRVGFFIDVSDDPGSKVCILMAIGSSIPTIEWANTPCDMTVLEWSSMGVKVTHLLSDVIPNFESIKAMKII